ncbi:hypothetical protein GLOIN_2v1781328 [Rhizophagus irregularis DAOM 181602=DAOM 197198]|nr:hypothetical protein GLOIN_2v1781328 [Rhizophagus irregularis DAOM 181602=DAOM 197198]
MEIHIGNYLDSNNYTNWSTSGLLQYLVEKENYTTEDATIFIMLFAVQEQDQRAQNQEYQWAQRQQDQRIQPQCQFIQTLIHDYSTLYEQK